MRAVGPVVSIVAASLALSLLALAPLGWRLGWCSFSFALFELMPASGLTAAVVPLRTALPVGGAFSQALAVAQAMPGLTIVGVDRDKGRIEASARTSVGQ